jgi:hypothetical protein
MPLLSIAGVELPVTVDSLSLSLETIGTAARNTRGHGLLERRASKWGFNFSLSPCPLDEAMLYRSLILGDGEFWSTASSAYGAKGLALTGTGAWTGAGGGNPVAGSGNGVWRTTIGQTLVVPGKLSDQSAVGGQSSGVRGASLAGWRYDEGAASWRLFAWSWRGGETTVPNKREKVGAIGSSGAAQAYTGTETLAVSSGTLTVTSPGSGGGWRWSNLLLIPWFLPVAQLDQLLEGLALVRNPMPLLPRVYVTSDLLSSDQLKATPFGSTQSALVCTGEVSEMQVTPLARAGAWQTTDCTLSGKLTEV